MSEETPKLHIDTDWKAEAQAEKERLAKKEQERAPKDDDSRGLPAADFRGLVSILASQAIMGLGAMADQNTGRVVIDLEGSRFAIDLLGVLEDKTKGNLSEEESKELSQIAGELRQRFVQVAQAVAEQQAGSGAGAPGVATPPPGG